MLPFFVSQERLAAYRAAIAREHLDVLAACQAGWQGVLR